MAAFNKINAFVENLAEGVHNLGADALVLAFCLAANAPVATNSVLADLTTVSTANLDSVALTVSSSSQTSGTYRLIVADKTITNSGGTTTFRYVVVVNDTPTSPADPLVGWYDYGSDLTLQDGEQFTVDLDGTNGMLSVA